MKLSQDERRRRARSAMIDISRRGQRAGTGSRVVIGDTALRVWPDLSHALREIPWAVAGGVATRRYMPERATRDLDVLIRIEDAEQARQRLTSAGYEFVSELGIGGTVWRSPEGTEIDLIHSAEPWRDDALRDVTRDQQGLPVLSLGHLILMKLIAKRPQDSADISRMCGLASQTELDAVRALITRHLPDDLDDLDSLIAMGKLEFQTEEGQP